MVKFYGPRRRKTFDDDADWLPSRNRRFVLKNPMAPSDPEPLPEPSSDGSQTKGTKGRKKTSDSEGLRTAYNTDTGLYRDPAGTLHVAGTRGGFFDEDWMENYRVYGTGLLNTFKDYLGLLESGKLKFSDFLGPRSQPFDIEDTKSYKALDQYMKDNPGEVKNMVGHSKGGSVVEKWMENHPEWTGHARIYGTPHVDPVGSEAFKDYLNQLRQDRHDYYTSDKFLGPTWLADIGEKFENKRQDFTEWLSGFDQVKGVKEKHQLRISGEIDPFTILDQSAVRIYDPTWMSHLQEGGGHYYGNIADLFAGFDGPDGDGFIGNAVRKNDAPPTAPKWGVTWDIQKAMKEPWNYTTPVSTDPSP